MKILKTEAEYRAALRELETLAESDPSPRSEDGHKLELLAMLIRDYESKRFPASHPSPLDAIRFRMEQAGLTQRDLIPYLGSRSKVSEVLAGKRRLTLSMIRALHSGLGIPADVLLQDNDPNGVSDDSIVWSKFPLQEMTKRGWVSSNRSELRNDPATVMRRFLKPLAGNVAVAALYRRTRNARTGRSVDRYALVAWTLRVLIRALEAPPERKYQPKSVDRAFMREVAELSWFSEGPRLAEEFLSRHGVALIVEPHLATTRLDGVAVLSPAGFPVIGLTLRYDRLDYFWFCLMHELVHVARHLGESSDGFYDDLDADAGDDANEREADEIAAEALIPKAAWENSPARNLRSPEAVKHLAERLRIHPAIVAGKIRHASNNFKVLNGLVGHGELKKMFPDIGGRMAKD